MGGFWIIVIILGFIGNRIFGLYKDETTTKILEDAGAIPRRKQSPRVEGRGYSGSKHQLKGTLTPPFRKRFEKNRTYLDRLAQREAKKILRKFGQEG